MKKVTMCGSVDADTNCRPERMPKNSTPNIFEVLLALINIMETQIAAAQPKTAPLRYILIQPA